MSIINNITLGQIKRLYKSIFCTTLIRIVNIVPFILSVKIVNMLFVNFRDKNGLLDLYQLGSLIAIMFLYIPIMIWGEKISYRLNFQEAYDIGLKGRLDLAKHLQKLSIGTFSSKDPGELSSMFINDFSMIEQGISRYLPQLIGSFILPIFAFIILIWVDWRMSLAMFCSLPISILLITGYSAVQQKINMRQIIAKIKAGNRFEEYLYGIQTIKAYNLTGEKFEHLKKALDELKQASIRSEALIGPIFMLCVILLRMGLTLMVLCGSYLLVGGQLSISTFVIFLIIGSRVFDPLSVAFTNLAALRYFSIAGKRILCLMKEKEMTGESDLLDTGDIVFKNVSFAYQKKMVLQNINIEIKQRCLTAIVGPSGSGKSTLMKLCARFYDPDKGVILLGNKNIREFDPEKLMKCISMVFQDVYLFQDTIKNNIRFGKENATEYEIIEAAKKAQCHDFIIKLPQGYDTVIGEGGCTLSGGEKQRVSIARAILKDAPIILLDEATSSLDPKNEVKIQHAINTLIKDRTVIVIAHKLKTISNADNIIVLNKGYIEEQGTHEELLKNKGLYAHLWDIQEKSCNWKVNV